ncbi:hypothetical protein PS15m_003549 [Mucor circinelloides]
MVLSQSKRSIQVNVYSNWSACLQKQIHCQYLTSLIRFIEYIDLLVNKLSEFQHLTVSKDSTRLQRIDLEKGANNVFALQSQLSSFRLSIWQLLIFIDKQECRYNNNTNK